MTETWWHIIDIWPFIHLNVFAWSQIHGTLCCEPNIKHAKDFSWWNCVRYGHISSYNFQVTFIWQHKIIWVSLTAQKGTIHQGTILINKLFKNVLFLSPSHPRITGADDPNFAIDYRLAPARCLWILINWQLVCLSWN